MGIFRLSPTVRRESSCSFCHYWDDPLFVIATILNLVLSNRYAIGEWSLPWWGVGGRVSRLGSNSFTYLVGVFVADLLWFTLCGQI